MDTERPGPFSVADVRPYAVPARLDDLQAVQLHGMAARPSEDIDLFGADRGGPAEVEADVVAAFRRHQFTVDVTRRTSDLVQMMVSGPDGETCKVDLGIFWRAREPVVLDVGPVLHPDDAAAGKWTCCSTGGPRATSLTCTRYMSVVATQ